MNVALSNFFYLIASVLFVIGIKGLTHPKTAVRGNLIAAFGMLLGILVTLFDRSIISYQLIVIALLIGSGIGVLLAVKIEMTSMPQLVALFNAFGGGASSLVAGTALMAATSGDFADPTMQLLVSTVVSTIIGSITFFGSVIAFGKLQGVVTEKALAFPGQQVLNVLLGLAMVGFAVWVVREPTNLMMFWILNGIAGLLGILMVLRVGGADMPVIIALLNSFSGFAAASAGFVLGNNGLIIAGSLVGSSGLILTAIMCKAMNRSLFEVMFVPPGLAAGGDKKKDAEIYEGKIKSVEADEVAMILDGAQKVVIVPGYGLAVAQAQHPLQALATMLEKKGCEVTYGIHPVAGRMPGHMNVLLAEADVPYEKLLDMDQVNPTFPNTDVVLVIGANDVVNPVAKTDPNSPIAGMPILNVDEARSVVVIKRSLSPGFAGIPNPLFAADNSMMYFGDARKAINDLITAMK